MLSTILCTIINQSAPDIRRKLQKLERLGKKPLKDLVEVVEKVYHNGETKDEKNIKADKLLNRDLAKDLLVNSNLDQESKEVSALEYC